MKIITLFRPHRRKLIPIAAASLAVLVGACGSGGGSTSTTPLQLSGVASTGAALKGASIEVKCANGTQGQSTSSTSTGAFTVDVTGGQLPCVLRASGTDESGNDITLHSVADSTTKANITPLTQVVVAAAAGASSKTPEEIFANFAADTTARTAVSATQLSYGQQVAVAAIKAAAPAVDLANINPMTADFTVGGANDQKIDTVIAALKTNASTASNDAVVSTLSQAVKTAAKANPSDATAAASQATSETTSAVAKPFPIPSCPAVQKSSPYRIVGLGGGNGLTSAPTVNGAGTAVSISSTWSDGSTENATMTFDSNARCKFSLATGSATPLTGAFAKSGLFVVQDPGSATSDVGIGIGFPEQTIPLAELAGVWNALEYSKDGNAWVNLQSTVTIDSSGKIIKSLDCNLTSSDYSTCTEAPQKVTPTFVANAAGGFDVNAEVSARAFAFRAPSGDLILVVQTSGSSGMLIATKQKAYPAPVLNAEIPLYAVKAEGTSTITSSFNALTFKATAYTATTLTSTGSVSNNGSITWLRTLLNGAADTWTTTDLIDKPRLGMNYRPAVQYTNPSNTSRRTPAALQLHTGGAGLTVSVGLVGSNAAAGWTTGTLPSEAFLQFTVRSN